MTSAQTVDELADGSVVEARITVVMESVTPEEYVHHGHGAEDPAATIEALRADVDEKSVSIIVMVTGKTDDLEARFVDLDEVSVVQSDASTYYEMKNAGAQIADTEFVAFIDSDCAPGPGWLRTVLGAFDGGADVVAGKTRYRGPGLLAQISNYFDFGSVETLPDGSGSQFHLNNVAMRRQAFLEHPIDTRLRRSGGCYMACLKMRAAGYRIVYAKDMNVIHGNDYKVSKGLAKRIRNGHDAATLRFVDDEGLLPHRWINQLGPLAAPLIVAARVKSDWSRLFRNRTDLDYSVPMVLLVCLVAVPMRMVEGGAFVVSSIRPEIIGKSWG